MDLVAEIFIIILCICIVFFSIYLAYVCYLRKYKAYKYEDGIPDVAILRPTRIGNLGFKHFSAAPFRTSQISISSSDRNRASGFIDVSNKRPYTFPLSNPQSNKIPEIRIHPA